MSPAELPSAQPDLAKRLEISDWRDARWFAGRYWKYIAASAFVGLAVGVVVSYFFPPAYLSEARVRFMPPQVAGRFVNPNLSMEVNQRLFALTQLLSSRLTATRMIESFNLYPERRRFQTVADLVPVFKGNLNVIQATPPENSNRTVPTLHIAFRYRDAELAKQVVQKMVEQVYEENRKYRGDQSLGTTDFLTQQLRAAEERMLEAEARLGEVQEVHSPHVARTELGANGSL